MPAPHRRHRFMLNLEADSLEELVGVLHFLADEIEAEGKDSRRLTYRGTSSTYEARLRTDPEQDCERYREQLGKWYRDQERSSGPRGTYDSVGEVRTPESPRPRTLTAAAQPPYPTVVPESADRAVTPE